MHRNLKLHSITQLLLLQPEHIFSISIIVIVAVVVVVTVLIPINSKRSK